MSYKDPLASEPIAYVGPSYPPDEPIREARATVISQYANSPVMLEILDRLATAFDERVNLQAFYDLVWNIDTAVGYGLDVWGRILGANRVLRIPADVPYLGWQQQAEAVPFGFGIWYGGEISTQNFALTDDAYRRLLIAKAALNICDGSIPAINAALLTLFPERGNCYVRDNGGMSMTYVFGEDLSPVEYAIVAQAGVLPKPIGVSVDGEVAA